jgi:tripartite-type tricarboxylate transporter receptor subunit TctC
VIGAPPGGTADIVARLLADGLQKEWGQPVIVEAKPGAAGMIAMQDFLGQPADGRTLQVSVNALVTEISHVVKLRFDPLKDAQPVAELARTGPVFVANAALSAKNVPELASHAMGNPGKAPHAACTAGTISHTSGLPPSEANSRPHAGAKLLPAHPSKGST